ncbi:MAG: class SAM-dependent methyltransferase [Herminiimonas sp.]|nr:class SAM-dependent methyltransferase [Herminiimonas sp.]
MENIVYQTEEIARYFAHNRVAWDQFYESERCVIERLSIGLDDRILDIGCGCGGLGLALRERFAANDYTGVEINPAAAEAGRTINPKAQILCGDILELSRGELRDQQFDVVFSLSCVDWNVRFEDMLKVAWQHVRPGGHFVATFRLTTGDGCEDFSRSYQYINYDGLREGERAAYVVLNAKRLARDLLAFDPSFINAFGYWGQPSATAVTPYEKLCFAAITVRKRDSGEAAGVRCQLELPQEILAASGLKTD